MASVSLLTIAPPSSSNLATSPILHCWLRWALVFSTGCFALPAFFTIDTWGQRNLLPFTFPFPAIFLFWTGFSFWFKEKLKRTAMVVTGMYLFEVFYSPGEGPVPFTYSAECFPLHVRDVGMSWATATTWSFNSVLSFSCECFSGFPSGDSLTFHRASSCPCLQATGSIRMVCRMVRDRLVPGAPFRARNQRFDARRAGPSLLGLNKEARFFSVEECGVALRDMDIEEEVSANGAFLTGGREDGVLKSPIAKSDMKLAHWPDSVFRWSKNQPQIVSSFVSSSPVPCSLPKMLDPHRPLPGEEATRIRTSGETRGALLPIAKTFSSAGKIVKSKHMKIQRDEAKQPEYHSSILSFHMP